MNDYSKSDQNKKNLSVTDPKAAVISVETAQTSCKRGTFSVSPELEAKAEEYISHYPQKRSASLMILHLLQEHYRYISPEALEWAAKKLEIQPINLYELVTFYPMFHRKPVGKFHIRICRTLSCAIAGSYELRKFLCEKLGLNPTLPGVQTTSDGLFTVEFVECLACCDKAPVVMVNEKLYEKVSKEDLQKLISELEDNEPGADRI
ncbi:MAG: NADH-quinone oxidoreductase subunit NuoE [Verrucomicrobiia bacterium]